MSDEKEPLRLKDDPAEDAGLRAVLDAAAGERAEGAMLERVLANVLAVGAGGGGPGGGGGIGASAKLAAAAAAIAATVGTVALLLTSDPAPPRPIPTASPAVSPVSDTSDAAIASVSDTSDAGALVPDTSIGHEGTVTDTRSASGVGAHTRPAPPTTSPGLDDGPLLLAATRARATDPERSLALALDHRARFPTSPSVEDREALVVLDLAALGRATEARTAAATFRARWPRSAHLPHLDAALARLPSP